MPRQRQRLALSTIGSPTLNGPLEGSVYIGEPEPGDQYRLFMIASGFGMNVKLVGSFKPNPETGQVTAYFEDLPQAPFEDIQTPPVFRGTGTDGDPDRPAPSTRSTPNSSPGTERCPTATRLRYLASNPVPTVPNALARSAPSTRPWKRELSTPTAGALLAPSP